MDGAGTVLPAKAAAERKAKARINVKAMVFILCSTSTTFERGDKLHHRDGIRAEWLVHFAFRIGFVRPNKNPGGRGRGFDGLSYLAGDLSWGKKWNRSVELD